MNLMQSRGYLGKWLPWVKLTNSVDTMVSFIKEVQKQYVSGLGFKAIIMFNGKIAGLIGYHNVDLDRKYTSIEILAWRIIPRQGDNDESLREVY